MEPIVFDVLQEDPSLYLPKVRKTVVMGRGDHKIQIPELYAGFDIETTNIIQPDGWAAYMYHAQFSIATEKECCVYLFRHWEHFEWFIEYIIQAYDLSSDRRMIVYIANMGFEFQFICKRFSWDEEEYSFFAKEERQPLKATYHGIEFREALSISGGNLAFLAKTYCTTQKLVGDLDYMVERNSKTILTPEERAYCINDVVILSEFSQYMFDHYIRRHHKIPMTKTSILIDQYKHNMTVMCRDRDRKNNQPILTSYYEWKDYLQKCMPDQKTYEMWFKYLFRGGYVHANALYSNIETHVRMRDVTSHYPGRMNLSSFARTPFKKIPRDDFKMEWIESKCCILHVVFDFIRTTTPHSIESSNKCVKVSGAVWDNGRLVSADYLEVYLTDLDWKIYQLFYRSEVPPTILECWTAERGKLPPYLMKVLNSSYKEKHKLKVAGLSGSQEYAVQKSVVNSSYGSLVKRIRLDQVTYDNEIGWTVKDTHPEYIAEMKKQVLLPQWGIWVTSAARYELLSVLYKLTKAGVDVVYMDTDSIKYRPSHVAERIFHNYNNRIKRRLHNRKLRDPAFADLGTFDLEEGGAVVRFKTLGAKRYIYTTPEGKVKATIAGMPKVSIKMLGESEDEIYANFTAFGFSLAPEISGKLTTKYRDEPHDAVIGMGKDRDYMHEESSVALYRIPFTLTLSDDYQAYMEEVQEIERKVL